MDVRRNFSMGGTSKFCLSFSKLMTMQWEWTFTKRFTLSFPFVCAGWTLIPNLLSEMFSTLRLSEMLFLFINCLISIFFEHFLQISHNSKNNQRREQHERCKNKEVRHSCKTVSSNEKYNYILIRLSDNLLKLRAPRRLKKTEQMNCENSPQQI